LKILNTQRALKNALLNYYVLIMIIILILFLKFLSKYYICLESIFKRSIQSKSKWSNNKFVVQNESLIFGKIHGHLRSLSSLHVNHSLNHANSMMLIVNFKYFLLLSIQVQRLLALGSIRSIRLSVNCCESHWSRNEYVISCISSDWNLSSFNWHSAGCIRCCNSCPVHEIILMLSIVLILILELWLLSVFIAIVICHISFIWYSNCSFLIMTV